MTAAKERQKNLAGLNGTLEALRTKLAEAKFAENLPLDSAVEGEAYAMVWGTHRGGDTTPVFLAALPPGHWEKANAEYITQVSWTQAPAGLADDQYPKFGLVSDGEHEAVFDLEYPPHQIDRLP